MPFKPFSKKYLYLFLAVFIILIIFLIYVFIYDHKSDVIGFWKDAFKKIGLSDKQINDVSHDDDVWYYKNTSTCVGYSEDFNKVCPKHEVVCDENLTYGGGVSQAMRVKDSIFLGNEGEHKLCPLIYSGAD